MGFAKRRAAELRYEARQLREIGLNDLADEREREAAIFERVADEISADRSTWE